MTPPEPPDVREHWREGLNQYLARKERTRQLRAELAAARAAGKARRHADRLARAARESTPSPREETVKKPRRRPAGHRCQSCGTVKRPNQLTSTRAALLCSRCFKRLPEAQRVDVQPWPPLGAATGGELMGRPNVAQRLQGLQGCGCTDRRICQQHWQVMSRAERQAFMRRLIELNERDDDV